MASGHVNRIYRPNTWQHRPSLRRDDFSCQPGAVHTWHLADLPEQPINVRFSNRPFGVKRFQTIHHCNVDLARGLVLLFGIGTRALPSWDSKTRRNNLLVGLAVSRTKRTHELTSSIVPRGTSFHPSTIRWSSSFLLSGLIL